MSVHNRAIFLDRDGTLVHPRHYPSRPQELELYPGIARPLARLQAEGFALIVITNQSGIARGLFTARDLDAMHASLRARLAVSGVRIDGFYHCPHHPEGVIPELAVACDCRKPATGMLCSAATEFELALDQCWCVGDILDDIEAGNRAGCRTVLVDLGTEGLPGTSNRTPDFVAKNTMHALHIVEFLEGIGPSCDLEYQPATWSYPPARLELVGQAAHAG